LTTCRRKGRKNERIRLVASGQRVIPWCPRAGSVGEEAKLRVGSEGIVSIIPIEVDFRAENLGMSRSAIKGISLLLVLSSHKEETHGDDDGQEQ
jgi:hypothetical protein